MGGGHAKSSIEPQHNSLQSHQFHSILAAVQSRGGITWRNQTSKFAYNSGGITMPKRSWGERSVGIRQDQSSNQLAEVSRRDDVLEGSEGQEKRVWHWQPSPLAEPRMESSGKLESKWEGLYVVIEKTRPKTPHGPTRTEAGTLVERKQSTSLLCLTFCKIEAS
jgi:hypothetical protein